MKICSWICILLLVGCSSFQNKSGSINGRLPSSLNNTEQELPCLKEAMSAVPLGQNERAAEPPNTSIYGHSGADDPSISYFVGIIKNDQLKSSGFLVKMNKGNCSLDAPPARALPVD